MGRTLVAGSTSPGGRSAITFWFAEMAAAMVSAERHGAVARSTGLLMVTPHGTTSLPLPARVVSYEGRRYLIGAYGDVQWTRNLRAAGEAEFRLHGRTEHVTARELDRTAATAFFRDTLPGFVSRLPWFGRLFAAVFLRLVGPELLSDPERAAVTRPVFEISQP